MSNDGNGMKDTITYRNKDTGGLEKVTQPVGSAEVGPTFAYVTNEADNDAKFEQKYKVWQELHAEREPDPTPDIKGEYVRQYEERERERSGRRVFSVPGLPWKKGH